MNHLGFLLNLVYVTHEEISGLITSGLVIVKSCPLLIRSLRKDGHARSDPETGSFNQQHE